jgi:hypothetical protein
MMIYLNGDGTTRAKDEPRKPAPGEDGNQLAGQGFQRIDLSNLSENNPYSLPAWVQVAQLEMRLRAEMLEMVERMRQEIEDQAVIAVEVATINAVEAADITARQYVLEAHTTASGAQVETKPRPDFITIKDIPGVYAAVSEQTVRWWIFVNREGFNSRCVSRRGRKVLINRRELEKWLAEREG